LFVGPVFTREAVTVPRGLRFYIARGVYVLALWFLLLTAYLILAGTQIVRNVGDLARFAAIVFQILVPLQLAVLVFFAALSAASAVSLEKDRKTLILLLITRLTNSELVLGKLLASLVYVVVMLAAALPLFMLMMLFGGVSLEQIGRAFAVTLASAVAAGSLGSTLALWREKTFQTLALTALILVFWLATGEVVRSGALGNGWLGISAEAWSAGLSPWRAVLEAASPFVEELPALGWLGTPVNLFLAIASGVTVLLNALSIGLVRIWNPSREARQTGEDPAPESIWGPEYDLARESAAMGAEQAEATGAIVTAAKVHAVPRTISDLVETAIERRLTKTTKKRVAVDPSAPLRTRRVWDNPILWREMRTWAYGRKVLVIRLAYWLLFALAASAIYVQVESAEGLTRGGAALVLVPLFVLSLLLVNAQAVTSLTSERDAKALDLLLVTDITPQEFVYGKLGGVLYNTKDMILLPLALCGYLWWAREISSENLAYLVGGLAVMYVFVSMLGVHAGMSYDNSRSAIAASLGTVFFLCLGVLACVWMLISFSGSFQFQLIPFFAMLLGGGVGLFVALGWRNPSPAIGLAAITCPFATFYAIISSMIEPPQTLGVFLITAVTYGFTTAAMLIPAIYEFDVATGRTTVGEE
jgi:hypothetical protein